MAIPFSIFLLGTDHADLAVLYAQFENETDFLIKPMTTSDPTSSVDHIERIDLLLIMNEPKGDLVKDFQAAGYKGPILALGETATQTNETLSLPLRMAHLISRLKFHIRNYHASPERYLTIGPFRLYPALRHLVDGAKEPQKLTDREVDILQFLYHEQGKTVQRERLLSEIWGFNASVTTHTLETHVYRIRQKIEDDPNNAKILVTDEGGYRLTTKIGAHSHGA